jgi:hypothetical protein
MAKYIVRPGASFRMPDGSVKTGGDEIELDSDVVANHPNTVDPVPEVASAAEALPA